MTNLPNLYEIKVSRMSDPLLLQECAYHLTALEANKLDAAHKIRAVFLFTEAAKRDSMKEGRTDFLIALQVLKHL